MSITNRQLSEMERNIVRSILHVGWYQHLWFPRVERDALNYPDGPSDEDVQARLLALVEKEVIRVGIGDAHGYHRLSDVTTEILEDIRTNPEAPYELEIDEQVALDIRNPHGGLW